jgi:hypothetical protein
VVLHQKVRVPIPIVFRYWLAAARNGEPPELIVQIVLDGQQLPDGFERYTELRAIKFGSSEESVGKFRLGQLAK